MRVINLKAVVGGEIYINVDQISAYAPTTKKVDRREIDCVVIHLSSGLDFTAAVTLFELERLIVEVNSK